MWRPAYTTGSPLFFPGQPGDLARRGMGWHGIDTAWRGDDGVDIYEAAPAGAETYGQTTDDGRAVERRPGRGAGGRGQSIVYTAPVRKATISTNMTYLITESLAWSRTGACASRWAFGFSQEARALWCLGASSYVQQTGRSRLPAARQKGDRTTAMSESDMCSPRGNDRLLGRVRPALARPRGRRLSSVLYLYPLTGRGRSLRRQKPDGHASSGGEGQVLLASAFPGPRAAGTCDGLRLRRAAQPRPRMPVRRTGARPRRGTREGHREKAAGRVRRLHCEKGQSLAGETVGIMMEAGEKRSTAWQQGPEFLSIKVVRQGRVAAMEEDGGGRGRVIYCCVLVTERSPAALARWVS